MLFYLCPVRFSVWSSAEEVKGDAAGEQCVVQKSMVYSGKNGRSQSGICSSFVRMCGG